MGPELPDLIAGLVAMIALVVFLQYWKPPYRAEYACTYTPTRPANDEESKAADKNQEQKQVEDVRDGAKGDKTEVTYDDHPHDDAVAGNSGGDSTNSNKGVDGVSPSPITELAKPTLLESIVAWSPWVSIIVVVIM